jgi:hypothetical protein
MDGPEINSTPDTEPSKPPVLIPVMAEDVERRQRKVVLSWLAAALALALVIWFVYRRSIDPLHAQESYDAGVRLIRATRYAEAILNFDRTIDLKHDFADAYRRAERRTWPRPTGRCHPGLHQARPDAARRPRSAGRARLRLSGQKDYAKASRTPSGRSPSTPAGPGL